MLVVDVIKDCSDATAGINSFGSGVRAYANLEQENESFSEYNEPMFPRCWLYTFSTEETIHKSGHLERVYLLTVDITDLHNLDDSSQQITDQLLTMYSIATEFILRVFKHTNVEYVKSIRREPLQHHLDHNTIGYAIQFKVKLFTDDTVYPCP